MRAFADAIQSSDLYAGDREPEPLHALVVDHPSASSRRLQKAECGANVWPSEMAPTLDDITCPKCLRVLEVREELTV